MSNDFDALMSRIDPNMIIVTTAAAGELGGCLVGFHAQSSIEPPRYSVWLSKANHTYRLGLRATHFAIHYLDRSDLDLAERFGTLSGDDVDKFDQLPLTLMTGGVPVLDACPNWIVAKRIALLDEGGDHVCVSTEPVATRAADLYQPLRLSEVAHLTPGHSSQERNAPPTERAVTGAGLTESRRRP